MKRLIRERRVTAPAMAAFLCLRDVGIAQRGDHALARGALRVAVRFDELHQRAEYL